MRCTSAATETCTASRSSFAGPSGVVAAGFGLATESLAPVLSAICAKSRLEIVAGTLNVRLDEPYIVIPDLVLEAREYGHP